MLRTILLGLWRLLVRADRVTRFSSRLMRPLIAAVERRILGRNLAPRELLEHMSRGGLRALETRAAVKPAIAVFAVVDAEQAVVQTFGRPDVSQDVLDELGMYLTDCLQQYFEPEDATPTAEMAAPGPESEPAK
jgi:hypothetical protein